MPDTQPTPDTIDPAEYANEGTVLDLLILRESQRPWSMQELALEIGSRIVTEDAVANLHSAGLLHKTSDGFIFASRAAVHYHDVTQ